MILEMEHPERAKQNRLSQCKDLQAGFVTGEVMKNDEKLAGALESVQQMLSTLPDASTLTDIGDEERFVFEDFVQIVGDHIRDIAMGNGGQSLKNIETARALWQELAMLQDAYDDAEVSDDVKDAA
ncbi:hypothetical protein H6758_03075 [Candidatus Nomurabacteria bacterium]|nr:hypothetical protein [Candidatus Nomurabacteria bacterium]